MSRITSLLLFLLPFTLFSQNSLPEMATFLIPDSLSEGSSSVIRTYEEVFELTDRDSGSEKVRKVVTIFNGDSRENILGIAYDNDSKITKFKASLYDHLGQKIRDVKKSEITDQMAVSGGTFYSDSRVQYVDVEYSEYPYTIVFEYEKKLSGYKTIWTPLYIPQYYGQSVIYSQLTVKVPAINEILYDAYLLEEPVKKVMDGQKEYIWKVGNLTAVQPETYAPVLTEVLPNVVTALKRVEITPGVVAGFENWEEYGKLKWGLYKDRDQLPEALVAEIHALVDGLQTDREKIDLLYRFMQKRMRYVGVQLGVGGWQPFDATYVEDNRYGDCKALSNYMFSILKEVGIESYPTVVFSGDNPPYKFKPEFTSPYGSNHVILYVPGEDMYLECTSNYDPPGYLSPSKADRYVLWMKPDGGELVKIPPVNPTDHGHLRTQYIKLTTDGTAQVELKTRYVGAPHERWRYLTKELSEKDLKEQLQYAEEIPDVTGFNFKMVANDDEPFVDLTYQTELPRYARKMGKRFFVPINKFFAYDKRLPKLEKRNQPIVFTSGRFFVDSITIELPESLTLEAVGETNVKIDHPRGEYEATTSLDGNMLTWVRTLKLKQVTLPAEAYDDLRDFYLEIGKAEKRQLVFKTVTR